MESESRSNYYKLLQLYPKPFNKKQGLFNHFIDRTKVSLDMDKLFKEDERLKNL